MTKSYTEHREVVVSWRSSTAPGVVECFVRLGAGACAPSASKPTTMNSPRSESTCARIPVQTSPPSARRRASRSKGFREYLREGRLVLARTVEWLKCERCDAPLATGRLCEKCAEELQRGVGAAPSAERPADAGYPVPGGRESVPGQVSPSLVDSRRQKCLKVLKPTDRH